MSILPAWRDPQSLGGRCGRAMKRSRCGLAESLPEASQKLGGRGELALALAGSKVPLFGLGLGGRGVDAGVSSLPGPVASQVLARACQEHVKSTAAACQLASWRGDARRSQDFKRCCTILAQVSDDFATEPGQAADRMDLNGDARIDQGEFVQEAAPGSPRSAGRSAGIGVARSLLPLDLPRLPFRTSFDPQVLAIRSSPLVLSFPPLSVLFWGLRVCFPQGHTFRAD